MTHRSRKAKRLANYPAQELKQRVMTWAVKLRVSPKIVRVQTMTRKWGSCSTAGIVTLAYDLSERSPSFQDFVIVHELLHLRLPNHGRLFRALMTLYVPRWRSLELELQRS
jgi:predicted metal-dependent hydrolase